jgi:hypothetical protein
MEKKCNTHIVHLHSMRQYVDLYRICVSHKYTSMSSRSICISEPGDHSRYSDWLRAGRLERSEFESR